MIYLKELMIYFYDDIISIIYNGQVIEKKLDSIYRGLVVNRTDFMESFLGLLKKERIKSKLFGDKIYIVRDAYFNNRDLFYLENLFLELGFIKVIFIDIYELFSEEYTYIGVFKDYMVFYLDKPLVMDLTYFKDIPKLIAYFKEYYQTYVILFGTNHFIPAIKSQLVPIYYVDHYQNYITQSLLKVKKIDG